MRNPLYSHLAREWPHLPLALRVLTVLGFAAALASFGIATWTFQPLAVHHDVWASRGVGLAPAFGTLSLACAWPVMMSRRLRAPHEEGDARPISARTIGILSLGLLALPLIDLVCAALLSPATKQYQVVFPIRIISAWLLFAAFVWAMLRNATPIG